MDVKLFQNPYKVMLISLVIIAIATSLMGATDLLAVVLTLVFSVATDTAITYMKLKKFVVSEGPMISGLILGLVFTSSPVNTAAAAILAQTLKHLVKFDNRNIFNPASLGMFLIVAFFPGFGLDGWHGSAIMWLTFALGVIVSWKIKRFPASVTFIIAFIILNFAISGNASNSAAFSLTQLFLAFFMLVEPKTSPADYKQQIAYGIIIATVATVGFSYGLPSPPLLGLLVGNASRFLLLKIE